MRFKLVCISLTLVGACLLAAPRDARAQETPWSVDIAIGWDNGISGDFLTGDIGTLQGLPVVIDKRKWDDVYGTGLLFNIAVGYTLNDRDELRGGFTYQSTGSDDTLAIGTYRGGALAARFDDYSAWTLDAGYRRYFSESAEQWRPYAGGTIGFGRVQAIEADLAQTGAGFGLDDTDFYGGNGAITLGGNAGVLYNLTEQVALDARIGIHYVSGLSDVDETAFSGLDDVNNGSSRWSLPITVGAKVRF